jgi:hypothetical protein
MKAQALKTVFKEGLYDPDLPHSLHLEQEKVWLLPGRYKVHHVQRKVERCDKVAMTDAQWHTAIDNIPNTLNMTDADWLGKDITITEQADFNKWTIDYKKTSFFESRRHFEVGYKHRNMDRTNTYFENGGVTEDVFGSNRNGRIKKLGSWEFRVNNEGDLIHEEKFLSSNYEVNETVSCLAKRVDFYPPQPQGIIG